MFTGLPVDFCFQQDIPEHAPELESIIWEGAENAVLLIRKYEKALPYLLIPASRRIVCRTEPDCFPTSLAAADPVETGVEELS